MPLVYMFALVLSLAGLLTLILARFHLKARAEAYTAKKRRAMCELQLGHGHPPTWYQKGSAVDEFIFGVRKLASRKGVSHQYTDAVLEKEVNLRRLIWYVGALEDLGATTVEQQIAASDLITEWWVGAERARSFDLGSG